MTDLCAHHPQLGSIDPETTPSICQKFREVEAQLLSEGIAFQGSPERGCLSCHVCCCIVSDMLQLKKSEGFFYYEDYQPFLENADWGTDRYSRRTELFIKVCLEEKLAIDFI